MHFVDLVGILRVANSGDGMQSGVQGVGSGAAQKIHFVGAGGGNKQIRILHTGVQQHLHGGAVAMNGDDIVALQTAAENLIVGIHQSDVIALGRQLAGQSGAYLTSSGNDNIHGKAS